MTSFLPIRPRRISGRIRREMRTYRELRRFDAIYREFRDFTMIAPPVYRTNLQIASMALDVQGCVVECGVWRGGMSAGMAAVLGPTREYFLFDSFEGLPPAAEIDGKAALAWQADKTSPMYFDNCRAEMSFAEEAMRRTAVRYTLVQGWFDDTLPKATALGPIAVLRLDADWYGSTMVCLESFYSRVTVGGIIIIDDYFTWDGCSKAVHDFLAGTQSRARLHELNGVCFIRIE